MPLKPVMGSRDFSKWGIDFIGLGDQPTIKTHAQYIIAITNYVTKWVEVKATQKNDAHAITKFLFENVFTQYGLPFEIMSKRGLHFLNEVIYNLLDKFMVIHKKLVPYHTHTPMDRTKAPTRSWRLCLQTLWAMPRLIGSSSLIQQFGLIMLLTRAL